MTNPASTPTTILITEVGSYLGASLAEAFLKKGTSVYGAAPSRLPKELLTNQNFTLLEIDLSQPLPAYLPAFDAVFDLSILEKAKFSLFSQIPTIPQETKNIISQFNNVPLFVFSKITTGEDFFDFLTHRDIHLKTSLKLLLVGDLYGPGVPENDQNNLANLIHQAIRSDKIILEDEGLQKIYPAYIDDATSAIVELTEEQQPREIFHLISEGANTTLGIAYEIQDIARLVLGKELGLFFAGPQKEVHPEPEIIIRSNELPHIEKTKLKEGLKATFQFFVENHQVTHEKTYSRENRGIMRQSQKLDFKIEKPKRNVLEKFPKFTINNNIGSKKIFLLVFVILLLFFAKTALDLYLGATNLKAAKSKLVAGDVKSASQKAQSAQKSFHAASNKIKILPVKNLGMTASALEDGAKAAAYFTEGAQGLSKNLYGLTHTDATDTQDFDMPSANFQKASLLANQASVQLKTYAPKNVFVSQTQSAIDGLTSLSFTAQSAHELSSLIPDITGAGTKKTYLVLLQNNAELRPGGGFIGNYATVDFDGGKLKTIDVSDIYTIDGQLKEKIEPPKELKEKLGTTQLYLRDSNWSPDNTLNAQTERDLFKKETGREINGIITIDLTFVQELLGSIGPIRLEDFKEDITEKNLFEKGEYYSEIGFFPGSTQKKDFFGALSRALINKIVGNLSESGEKGTNVGLLTAIKDGLAKKHLMLTFDSPNVATYVATHGWNQPIPPIAFNPTDDGNETRDFLAISEANLGANKVNRFISRKIDYEMTIGRDADLVAKLKITYTNNSQADTWPGGKYVNFLRVYVPQNSGMLEVNNGGITDLKTVETQSQGSLTAVSTFVEVPIKSTKEITLRYRIPKNIKLETAPTYHLYVSKQPGTDQDPLTFTFNLPQYLAVKSINANDSVSGKQNVITETNLFEDRQFTIDVAKR